MGTTGKQTLAPVTITAPVAPAAAATTSGMAGMDHGSISMAAPFDAMFIDGMIVHHQGAIDMAKDAQTKATKPEIKALTKAIIKAQDAEIKQMQTWRKQWYPDLKDTGSMRMNMGPMSVAEGSEAYDVRFIAAMIPHHESAIMMAQQAKQRAEHTELKTLADDIIKAQTTEIEQMKQWYSGWAGKSYAGAIAGMDQSAMGGAMPMSGDFTIAFSTEPTLLKTGPGTLIVMLTDKDGKPVEGAEVKLSLSMTTMDMGTMNGTATDEGSGRYTIKTNFDHSGGLKIVVEATKDKLAGKQEFTAKAK